MKTVKYLVIATGVAFFLVGCGDNEPAKTAEPLTEATTAPKEVKVEESKEVIEKQLSELGQAMQETAKKIEAQEKPVSKEEQEKMMMEALSNTQTMKNAFTTQKEGMPKMVTLLKEARECLGDADSQSDAEACQKKMEAKAKEMGMPSEEDDAPEEFTWDEATKTETLKDMDEVIAGMEKALPCIEKAQNIMEMAGCMGEDIKR